MTANHIETAKEEENTSTEGEYEEDEEEFTINSHVFNPSDSHKDFQQESLTDSVT